jgi:hypothetical protein
MSGREYGDEWFQWNHWEREAGAVDVVTSELVITRPADADVREYAPLAALLQRAQKAFGVEMAFISEWCGEPVLRPQAEADSFHASYGRRVLESDASGARFRVDALPVDAGNGQIHGTLCFRLPWRNAPEAEIRGAVECVGRLIASWFDAAAAS